MLAYIAQQSSIDFLSIMPGYLVNKAGDDNRLLTLNNDACTSLFDYNVSLAEKMINEDRFNPETLIEKLVIDNKHMSLQLVNIRPHYNTIIKYAVIHDRYDIFVAQMMIHGDDANIYMDEITKYDRRDMLEFVDQRFTLRGWNAILKFCIQYNSVRCANYVVSQHIEVIRFNADNQAILHAAVFHNRLQIVNLILSHCHVHTSILDYCMKHHRIPMLLTLIPRYASQWLSRTGEIIALQSVILPYKLRNYITPIGLIIGLILGWILMMMMHGVITHYS